MVELASVNGGDIKSDEWYTDARYIEAARLVLGSIDLDPASSAMANKTVKAERYYTKLQNGLAEPWSGRVWLNPPFGRENPALKGFGGGRSIMGQFVHKLIESYEAGDITAAIALVTSKTDARWFQDLWRYPLCFANHRVLFDRPGRAREGHFYGTVFAYLGPNNSLFTEIFSQFGTVVARVAPPKLVLNIDTQWEDPRAVSYEASYLEGMALAGRRQRSQAERHRLMYGDFLGDQPQAEPLPAPKEEPMNHWEESPRAGWWRYRE